MFSISVSRSDIKRRQVKVELLYSSLLYVQMLRPFFPELVMSTDSVLLPPRYFYFAY